MRHFTTIHLALAAAAVYMQVGAAAKTAAEEFLAANPHVLVGRDALAKAEASVGENTYSIVNKPSSDIVMIQEFDADTNVRLFAVALVNDEKAETYYKEHNQDAKDASFHKRCSECRPPFCGRTVDVGTSHLFQRESRCGQFCARGPSCTGDPDCPKCRYVGGNCNYQLSCQS